MRILKKATVIYAAVIFIVLSGSVNATPVIDGRLSSAEDYDEGYWVQLNVGGGKRGTVLSDNAQLWMYQDEKTGDLYVNFTQPVSLIDNSYGKTAIGWGRKVAPSNKKHRFSQLVNTDNARFTIFDGGQNVVFDFTMDYLSRDRKSPSKFSSLGVTGRDGKVHEGSADSLVEWATSLDYNFNELGYVLKKNSPTLEESYYVTDKTSYPGWRYEVTYEFRIDGSIFDDYGFGGLIIPYVHDSPNKIGRNIVYTQLNGAIPYEPVPEPATICLLGIGGLFLIRKRRTR
jgi:hypothetical protein